MNKENHSQGFVKLYRAFLDWEWYDDANTCRLFLHCLLKANHEDKQYRGRTIKRGSFLTGREALAAQTGLTVKQVRRSLEKLKRTNELAIKTSAQGTEIHVNKYDDYQEQGQQKGQQRANEGPAKGQRRATNKNEKNKKKLKEEEKVNQKNEDPQKKQNGAINHPTLEEVTAFCKQRGNLVDPVQWFSHYQANGWKVGRTPMRSWKAAVITWERRNSSTAQPVGRNTDRKNF